MWMNVSSQQFASLVFKTRAGCSDDSIVNTNGNRIEPKERIIYLGALLNSDGRIAYEPMGRIGMRRATFRFAKPMEPCKCQQGQDI